MTPKDALYKQRQAEFRNLNSKGFNYKVPKGMKPEDFEIPKIDIKHKEIYVGVKQTIEQGETPL